MAGFKFSSDWERGIFDNLIKRWPDLAGELLGYIGAAGRSTLKKKYLSGQMIELRAYPRDKLGRYTITSDVNRLKTAVKIYSYPVNLFEKGRGLRSGGREPGMYIITRRLLGDMKVMVPRMAAEFENGVLRRTLKKEGLQ